MHADIRASLLHIIARRSVGRKNNGCKCSNFHFAASVLHIRFLFCVSIRILNFSSITENVGVYSLASRVSFNLHTLNKVYCHLSYIIVPRMVSFHHKYTTRPCMLLKKLTSLSCILSTAVICILEIRLKTSIRITRHFAGSKFLNNCLLLNMPLHCLTGQHC